MDGIILSTIQQMRMIQLLGLKIASINFYLIVCIENVNNRGIRGKISIYRSLLTNFMWCTSSESFYAWCMCVCLCMCACACVCVHMCALCITVHLHKVFHILVSRSLEWNTWQRRNTHGINIAHQLTLKQVHCPRESGGAVSDSKSP